MQPVRLNLASREIEIARSTTAIVAAARTYEPRRGPEPSSSPPYPWLVHFGFLCCSAIAAIAEPLDAAVDHFQRRRIDLHLEDISAGVGDT